ncbi:hypothetical protein ACVINX_006634 [Bradyrhizobium diazoefficiens]
MAKIQNAPAISSATPTAADAHVLDLPDLLVVIQGQAIGELFHRGVEQLDHQHERHSTDQLDRAHRGRADEPGQRQRQQERKDLLANRLLRSKCKGQTVARIDRGLPDPQQGLRAPRRPASAWPCRRVPA